MPLPLGLTRERFAQGRTWVSINLRPEGWVNLEFYGAVFRNTPQVSLLLDPPADALFVDGFEPRISTVSVRVEPFSRRTHDGPATRRDTAAPALRIADAPRLRP